MKIQRLLPPLRRLNRLAILLGAIAASSVSLPAMNPSEWRYEQTLEVATTGLVRVALPPATLDAARPELEDLRVADPEGAETPLLIERPMPSSGSTLPASHIESELQAQATVLTVTTEAKSALGAVTLTTPATDFIKAVRVEGSHDRTHWEELTAGQTIFRLASGAEKLGIDFAPGEWELLRISIDDSRSKPAPFTGVQLHLARSEAPKEPIEVSIKSRDEIDGKTRLALDLGASNLTIASLSVETPEALFTRRLSVGVPEVSEDGIREQPIGQGMIYRVALEDKNEARLSLPLEKRIFAREVILFVENNDNPPLEISKVQAARRIVYAVFFAKTAGRYKLVTGNSQCRAPKYDIPALAAALKTAATAEVAPSALAENPGFKLPEALSSLTLEGAPIDPADWRFRSAVELSRPGAQELELNLDALAGSAADQRDLRLVRDGRQLPFLEERTSISRAILVGAVAAPDPKRPSLSRWSLKLPKPALPITRIVCASSSPLFQRDLRAWEEVANESGEKYERELGRAAWKQTPQQPAREFAVALSQVPMTDTLIVETDNGDNPAIELRDFRCSYSSVQLVFKAAPVAAKPLWLYYGNGAAAAPHYDLSLVANELLRAEKAPAKLGAVEALKPPRRIEDASAEHGSWFLWGALAVVVAGLLTLIARLIPKTGA